MVYNYVHRPVLLQIPMTYNYAQYPVLLKGIEVGLAEGIPDIADQPWKVLEVAMKHIQPEYRAALYHDWQLLYKPKKPTKLQKKDLKSWGINGD